MTAIPGLSDGITITIVLFAALLLDRLFGEPNRLHPLIGFGQAARLIERKTREVIPGSQKIQGTIAWFVAVVIPGLLFIFAALALRQLPVVSAIFSTFVLYLTLGGRSLTEHAMRVAGPLAKGELQGGRDQVAMIVSRNTETMSEQQICSATVESVLENGNDAVIGPLIWFVIAGVPGAVMFRLVNTLDAMWGYKNEQYRHFGWCAARADDWMGWLPARITALLYLVQGNIGRGLGCWKKQASQCKSPNGGVVMTAGAGAMGVTIGGPAHYHGKLEQKSWMGCGPIAGWRDIAAVCRLVERSAWLLVLCALLINLAG